MLIIETPVFTKRVVQVLTDEEYRQLQSLIIGRPDGGDLIRGGHGLRKLRWTVSGRGKRGGTRIIYYWLKPRDIVLMLFVFKKNERSDLTKDQLKKLGAIVEQELR
jgi:mRNA-degrading endonuclease RelE of RelBE toxin-antitoxin system